MSSSRKSLVKGSPISNSILNFFEVTEKPRLTKNETLFEIKEIETDLIDDDPIVFRRPKSLPKNDDQETCLESQNLNHENAIQNHQDFNEKTNQIEHQQTLSKLKKICDFGNNNNLNFEKDIRSSIRQKEPINVTASKIAETPIIGNKNKKKELVSQDKTSRNTSEVQKSDIYCEETDLTLQFDDSTPIWAQKEHLRDKRMKPFDDPDYDPTTLYIPPDAFKKLTPAMSQFWLQKSENFDKIIFFKLGKFYELFYDDAAIGVQYLDLNYMGRKQHAGFPESALEKYLKRLVNYGFKVAIVEQIETDRELKNRVKGEKTDKNNKIIRRELVSAVSKGTLIDTENHNDFVNLWSLFEQTNVLSIVILNFETNNIKYFSLQTTGHDFIAQLKIALLSFPPDEITFRPNMINERTNDIISNLVPKPQFSYPKKIESTEKQNILIETIKHKNPVFYQEFTSMITSEIDTTEREANYANFIQLFSYLDSMLLLEKLMAGIMIERSSNFCSSDNLYMDSQCLLHLEILATQNGTYNGSLMSVINYCKSPMGKRALKRWLQKPSTQVSLISERLQAIEVLQQNKNIRNQFSEMLASLKDIEKISTKLYKYSLSSERKAILFEDVTTKKLKELFDFLDQVGKILDGFNLIQKVGKITIESRLISDLLNVINSEQIMDVIIQLKSSVNVHKDTMNPKFGVCPEYDDCESEIESLYRAADSYAKKVSESLNCPEICIVQAKFKFELEIPEKIVKKTELPEDFRFTSKRQNFERYITNDLEKIIDRIEENEEKKKVLALSFCSAIFSSFLENKSIWDDLFSVVASLDVLCALSEFSFDSNLPLCRPRVFESNAEQKFLRTTNVKHPVLASKDFDFVGNNVELTHDQPIIVLSGPNMGGKSTIMRTLALNIVLAQIGCYVFADSFELTVVDKIFTRIGASDRLEEKKSTFFIEMDEMKSIIQSATPNSFLVIDELGRGTSTFDGYSIACACLNYLEKQIKSRCIFSTHYFFDASDLEGGQSLRYYQMGYEIKMVNGLERLRFKYTLEKGMCEKSFALNVAQLSGIEIDIIRNAEVISTKQREMHKF